MNRPLYVSLHESGELKKRVRKLKSRLSNCDICPRECHVNRGKDKTGFCRSGKLVAISTYCDHRGEEPVLSGSMGSGTIFFHNCNLKCVFCQNYQISQGIYTYAELMKPEDLAQVMLDLQNVLGCHNINLVSPSHFVPQIVEAVNHAVPLGLSIPLVYNTNAYDSLSTLKLLDGIIDIYLPDIKYASDDCARKYSHVNNYVQISRAAIQEMFRQVGNLSLDKSGIALRGLIVRHLILPNDIAGSESSLKWLANSISREITVSIMSQYNPCYLAHQESQLGRKITVNEYNAVRELVHSLGIENGWLQEMDSPNNYLPDFQREGHPFSVSC